LSLLLALMKKLACIALSTAPFFFVGMQAPIYAANNPGVFVAGLTFPAANVFDDRDPALLYRGNWGQNYWSGRYQGTQSFSNHAGDTVSFTFTASQISLIYARQSNGGLVNILIDGTAQSQILDLYSPTPLGEQIATYTGLGTSTHTITAEVVARPGSQSPASYVIVDGFIAGPAVTGVYDDRDPAVTYSGSWLTNMAQSRYDGTQSYSNVAGATASFAFSGTSASYVFARQWNGGYVQVSLDGTVIETIDEYSPIELDWQVATYSGFSDGMHILTVTTLGTANQNSETKYAIVDAFVAYPSTSFNDVQDDGSPLVMYSGSWTGNRFSLNYAGTESRSNHPSDSTSFSFSGSWVTYLYTADQNGGYAQVNIDGRPIGTIDQYSSIQLGQQVATWTGLNGGRHTITISVSASANSSSSDHMVVIDGFIADVAMSNDSGAATLSTLSSNITTLTGQISNVYNQLAGLTSNSTINSTSISGLQSTVNVLSAQLNSLSQALTSSTANSSTGATAAITFVDSEIPGGNMNGTNMTFSLAAAPNPASSLKLFKNGLLLLQSSDYALNGTTITFVSTAIAPQAGDSLLAFYRH
jgi:hypothetical protein